MKHLEIRNFFNVVCWMSIDVIQDRGHYCSFRNKAICCGFRKWYMRNVVMLKKASNFSIYEQNSILVGVLNSTSFLESVNLNVTCWKPRPAFRVDVASMLLRCCSAKCLYHCCTLVSLFFRPSKILVICSPDVDCHYAAARIRYWQGIGSKVKSIVGIKR